jgi:hypothetical protein
MKRLILAILLVGTASYGGTIFNSGALTNTDPAFANPGGSTLGTVVSVDKAGPYTFEISGLNDDFTGTQPVLPGPFAVDVLTNAATGANPPEAGPKGNYWFGVNGPTSLVPEPATIVLVSLSALVALNRWRRKSS